jgi:hypothetical protein
MLQGGREEAVMQRERSARTLMPGPSTRSPWSPPRSSTGYAPRSFDGSAQTVSSHGLAQWSWHIESRRTGGTATVTCSFEGQTRSAATSFSTSEGVAHRRDRAGAAKRGDGV